MMCFKAEQHNGRRTVLSCPAPFFSLFASYIMLRFITLAAASLLFTASCKDKDCPDYLQYQIPYTATPVQDTFQIGDTIWMEMNFADQLTDLRGGIQNTFSDFDFRIELQCDRIDINPPQAEAVSFMDVFPTVGEALPRGLSSPGVSYFEILLDYKEHKYVFRSAVVLNKQGSFLCGLNPSSSRINPFELDGNCTHLPLKINSKVNSGDPIANNYHLLKYSPVDAYRNMTMEGFGQNTFCFVVR